MRRGGAGRESPRAMRLNKTRPVPQKRRRRAKGRGRDTGPLRRGGVTCADKRLKARRRPIPFSWLLVGSSFASHPPPRRRWQPLRQPEWRRGGVLRRQSVCRDCLYAGRQTTITTTGITGANRARYVLCEISSHKVSAVGRYNYSRVSLNPNAQDNADVFC